MINSIAVIMCVYVKDDPIHLNQSIQSILNQSFPSDLLIYCDGFLTEELERVISNYESKPNIRIFRNSQNFGLAFGLNFLIDYIIDNEYSYIARMDSDDISYPERLSIQHSYLESNKNIDVLGGACREFGASFALEKKSLPLSHEELVDFSITRCPFIHPTVMFRASVFETNIRYPTNTSLTEDMALWFILLRAGFRFANLEETILDFRLNDKTIKRRAGISKALSEIKIRFKNMVALNRVSLRNVFLIFSRILFHILPSNLIKLAYKKLR